jgi:hypothetical protein
VGPIPPVPPAVGRPAVLDAVPPVTLIVEITETVLVQADSATDPSVVVAAVQHAKYFEGNTRRRYVDLAASAASGAGRRP